MYVFGGKKSIVQYSSELFCFDLNESVWEKLPNNGTVPALESMGLSVNARAKELIVYGGFNITGYSDKIYTYRLGKREWSRVEPNPRSYIPVGRASHGQVVANGELFVFGGSGQQSKLSDLCRFNFETREWKHLVLPGSPTVIPPAGASEGYR